MDTTLRSATKEDAERIAEGYLASRKQYVSFAPLAHFDEALGKWMLTTPIPTGGVIVATVVLLVVETLSS